MKNKKEVLYPKLAAKMAFYGETRKDLAKVLGIGYSNFVGRMSGRIEFKASELKKLSEHYQCTIDELI